MIFHCTAVPNTVTRPGRNGGPAREFTNPGFRTAIIAFTRDTRQTAAQGVFYNTKAPDLEAAQAFAILRAVETAIQMKQKAITLCCAGLSQLSGRYPRGSVTGRYLFVANMLIKKADLDVRIKPTEGRDNAAFRLANDPNANQGLTRNDIDSTHH